jgi:type II secretory pathway component PulF
MPKFQFKAYTQEGILKEGLVDAKDKEEALKLLQSQNLFVTFLKTQTRRPLFWQKPKLKDIYLFTRQLSYLLKAKTSLDDSIRALSETTGNYYFKYVLIEIYNDLIGGLKFSESLNKFPDLFNSYYVGLIKVGESIGSLDEVLVYLSEHIENQIKFRSRAIQALTYPMIVLVLSLGVMVILFYMVIPQITKIFIENNIPIPKITRIFQAISDGIVKYGFFLLVIFIFFVYYLFEYFKTREGKVFIFKIIENIPVISDLIRNIFVMQFLESFYYLLTGGVSIIESLEIIRDSIGHPLYESAIDQIIEDVRKGKTVGDSLEMFPNLFPKIVVESFKTSEKTGKTTEVAFTILKFFDETTQAQLGSIGEIIQPFLIILLGAGLGMLEASLLIPLLSLTKYVQNF